MPAIFLISFSFWTVYAADIDPVYQGTSWEYVQFLNLANNGQNAFLADEGANMLEAWRNTGMVAPYVMASATWQTSVSSIPAVSEWGMFIFLILLVGSAIWVMMRRKRNESI